MLYYLLNHTSHFINFVAHLKRTLSIISTSAYMVFHAEGFAGIELHYAAQLTIQSAQSFEDNSHHFPAAETALPAVDVPSADVPFLSSLSLLLYCYTHSLSNHYSLSAGESVRVYACFSLALHNHASNATPTGNIRLYFHRKYTCNDCIPVALLAYINTYRQTRGLHATQLVVSLPTRQLPYG